jgi:thiamine-monophosphate kinase
MELELIAHLRRRLPTHPLLKLGIGDDAAILDFSPQGDAVVTVDMLMEGVDFRLAEIDPRRAGRKALAVNLSDLAAMASRPLAALVALALPRQGGLDLAVQLYEGILPLAERYDVALAGGDTNVWDGPLVMSITALGRVTDRGPLRRGAARPGDRIMVTGALGGSIRGHHLDFEPRVQEALLLHERYELHAGIDISDGLTIDLARLAEESGCGAALELGRVPLAADARLLAEERGDGSTALDHALADGEDFELILAVPPIEAARLLHDQPLDIPITEIGTIVAESGLWQMDGHGNRRPLTPQGFIHR